MKLSTRNLLTIALVAGIKTCLFVYFAFNFSANWPKDRIIHSIFIEEGDTETYLQPIENLLNGNGYSTSQKEKNGVVSYSASAARMPGLLPVYGPLYFIFGRENGRMILIFFQLIADILSVFALALIAKKIFRGENYFFATLLLYSFSSFVSIFNHYGLSECFATSSLIFSLYYFLLAKESGKKVHWIISGIFLAWAIFMRPSLGLNLVLLPIILFFTLRKEESFSFRNLMKPVLFFMITFLVLDAAWFVRNKITFSMNIPLEAPIEFSYAKIYSPQQTAVQNLITAWGGDIQKWIPGSDANWFIYGNLTDTSARFPENHFTSACNMDSLLLLRRIFRESLNPALSMQERNILMHLSVARTQKYIESYRSEKPFRYYVLSKLTEIRRFVFVTTLHHIPFPKLSEMSFIQKVIKAGSLIYYYLIVLIGLAGMILLLFRKNTSALLFALIPVSIILLHAAWFGYIEHRYFVPAYPFFVLYAGYVFSEFFKSRNRAIAAGL